MPYRSISETRNNPLVQQTELRSMTDVLNAVGFSRPTFFRTLKLHRETGHVSKPRSLRHGRPRALNYSEIHHLLEFIKQRPD
ncbi:hypothetical protein M405DRAFT_745738 [Rhizopogon salebrosus TDB-379]|nr:hypothetical protein M405DRAFT_745738 [Rhizopogon salebrosus TDB-379]